MLRSVHITPLILAVGLSGCLPAYSNGAVTVTDMAGADMAGGDGGAVTGHFITGNIYIWDFLSKGQDGIGYVNGFPSNPSGMSSSQGLFQIPIPQAACGQQEYLAFDGMITIDNGMTFTPALHTLWGPKLNIDCTTNQNIDVGFTHIFADDPSMTGIRTTIARELAAHDAKYANTGPVDFGTKWNWFLVRVDKYIGAGTINTYRMGTATLDDGGTGDCTLVYTNSPDSYHAGQVPNLLDFTATMAPDGFIGVCKGTRTQEVMLTAGPTWSYQSQTGLPMPTTAPMVPGGAAFLAWPPQ